MQDIDVERLLIWTYRDQRAHLYSAGVHMHQIEWVADGRPVFGRSADGCAAIEDRRLMGTAIDVKGHAVGGMAIDDDAEHVHGLVEQLGRIGPDLIRFAQGGHRPSWGGDIQETRIKPVYKTRADGALLGAEVNRWKDPGDPKRAPGRLYCPIAYSSNAKAIRFHRLQYSAWRAGLVVLAYGLRHDTARLKRWRLTDDLPPEEPWLQNALAAPARV